MNTTFSLLLPIKNLLFSSHLLAVKKSTPLFSSQTLSCRTTTCYIRIQIPMHHYHYILLLLLPCCIIKMIRGTNVMLRTASRRLYATTTQQSSSVSLANLETRWATMSPAERSAVTKHLEEIQMGDWKALSEEQKKATCKNIYL